MLVAHGDGGGAEGITGESGTTSDQIKEQDEGTFDIPSASRSSSRELVPDAKEFFLIELLKASACIVEFAFRCLDLRAIIELSLDMRPRSGVFPSLVFTVRGRVIRVSILGGGRIVARSVEIFGKEARDLFLRRVDKVSLISPVEFSANAKSNGLIFLVSFCVEFSSRVDPGSDIGHAGRTAGLVTTSTDISTSTGDGVEG